MKIKKGIVAIRNAAQLSLDVSVALNPPVRKYEKVEIKLSLAIAVVIIPFIPRINEIITDIPIMRKHLSLKVDERTVTIMQKQRRIA